jgi:ATP-dependent DNA helicase RecG
VPRGPLNERQAKALQYMRFRGKINLALYRKLCPGFSDETLRRDLADLVERKMLSRNGTNRWTYYTYAS